MKMIIVKIIGVILLLWLVLTLIAERKGPERQWTYGETSAAWNALIVYNPDIFYNLDEQVCRSFAKALAENGWQATVATVAAAETMNAAKIDLQVFCANTYNWAPDWPTGNFIKEQHLEGKPVVAITLGSGSTQRAKRLLEDLVQESGGTLIASETYWLMRPNDETRTGVSNVDVAVAMAYNLGNSVSKPAKK